MQEMQIFLLSFSSFEAGNWQVLYIEERLCKHTKPSNLIVHMRIGYKKYE